MKVNSWQAHFKRILYVVFVMVAQRLDLDAYVGGEMEIQNQNEGYIFRGRVKSFVIDDGVLRIQFAWLAEGKGILPIGWKIVDRKEYSLYLDLCAVSGIGPSSEHIGGEERICFNCPAIGELCVLFPPDGSRLNKEKIEGLPEAFERLLALYPDLPFNRDVVGEVLNTRAWERMKKVLQELSPEASLQDFLRAFRSPSSAEEFLWYYIETVTKEKDVRKRVY